MNKQTKKTERVPTRDDKIRAIDPFINRLTQAFAYYFWVRSVRPMLAKHSDFKNEHFNIETVKNACLQTTLICIRDLDDFFSTKDKAHESDMRAQDFFGYKSPNGFLAGEERTKIHRWIVHLTYEGVWTGTTGIAPDKNLDWDTVDLLGKATRSACGFMDHLACVLSEEDPHQANSIQNIKMGFEQRLKGMENIARDATVFVK